MIECSNVWRKENREVHKFLRAIGFSDITKKDLEMILDEVITRPEIMDRGACPNLRLVQYLSYLFIFYNVPTI